MALLKAIHQIHHSPTALQSQHPMFSPHGYRPAQEIHIVATVSVLLLIIRRSTRVIFEDEVGVYLQAIHSIY
jgi:hypothetical protein